MLDGIECGHACGYTVEGSASHVLYDPLPDLPFFDCHRASPLYLLQDPPPVLPVDVIPALARDSVETQDPQYGGRADLKNPWLAINGLMKRKDTRDPIPNQGKKNL